MSVAADWETLVLNGTELNISSKALREAEDFEQQLEREEEQDRKWQERKESHGFSPQSSKIESEKPRQPIRKPVQLRSSDKHEPRIILIRNDNNRKDIKIEDVQNAWEKNDQEEELTQVPNFSEILQKNETPVNESKYKYIHQRTRCKTGNPNKLAPIFCEKNHIKEGEVPCHHGFNCKNKEECTFWHPAPGYDQIKFDEERWNFIWHQETMASLDLEKDHKKKCHFYCMFALKKKCTREGCQLAHDFSEFHLKDCHNNECKSDTCPFAHDGDTKSSVLKRQIKNNKNKKNKKCSNN